MKNKNEFDFSDNKMLNGNGIVINTDNFNFSLDAFPISKVHGLITPKNWKSSIEKLENNLGEELLKLYNDISYKIEKNIGGTTCYFEHGESGSTINGGSCNNHAHLHILNSGNEVNNYNEDVLEKMNKILYDYRGIMIKNEDIKEIDSIRNNYDYLNELKDFIKGGAYYQIGDGNKAYIVKNGNNYHKSQLIREAGAKLLNNDDIAFFDWKNTKEVIEFIKTGKPNTLIEELKGRINQSRRIFTN